MPKYYAVPTIDPAVFKKTGAERLPFCDLQAGNVFMTDKSTNQICIRGQVNKETNMVPIIRLGPKSCWTDADRNADDPEIVTRIRVKIVPDIDGIG